MREARTVTLIMSMWCCGLVAQEKNAVLLSPDRTDNGLLQISVTQDGNASQVSSNERRPGRLVIKIKNISPAQLFIEDTMPELDFPLNVIDEAGQPVSLTEEAKKYAFLRDPVGYIHVGRIRSVKLYPDEIYEKEIDVSRLYELKPGHTYTVRVKTALGPSRDHARHAVDRNLSKTVTLVMPSTQP